MRPQPFATHLPLPLRQPLRGAAILALAAAAALPASAALIVNDPVDSGGGWEVSGNGLFFLGACCGIGPTAGSTFIHIQNIGGRVASKTFSGLGLAVGSYVVQFDMGSFNNAPFAALSEVGLTAGGNLLATSSATTPTPGNSQVRTWTLNYTVAAGAAGLGSDLGFRLVAPNDGINRNASFDNLRIDFVAAAVQNNVPEPGALALAGLALAGLAVTRRRHQG